MSQIPSLKRIKEVLKLSDNKAQQMRDLLAERLDPETFDSVQKWRAQCYNWPPSRAEMVMCAANEILETHGVEAIQGEWVDHYNQDIRYTYCNTGDTYAATLIYDTAKDRYLLGSWGDLVENDPSLK